MFQIYSTLVVFTCVTHSSPSLTASLAILVSKRSPFYEISQNLKKSATSYEVDWTLDPIRCTRCVKSSLEPGGTQRTKSNLSPERVYR